MALSWIHICGHCITCFFLAALMLQVADVSSTVGISRRTIHEIDSPHGQNLIHPSIHKKLERLKRKARAGRDYWPHATIPYVIDESVRRMSPEAVGTILLAMQHWMRETCIRFVEWENDTKDYVLIKENDWCTSDIGRVGGEQHVFVNKSCLTKGVMIHELGHTVGFIHEHNRPDRDDYLIVRWSKITTRKKDYKKLKDVDVKTFGLPYDFSSIMQYKSVGDELLARDPRNQHLMGQRNALSFLDKKLAHLMYNCSSHCPKTILCRPPGFVNFKCKCVCPDGSSCGLALDVPKVEKQIAPKEDINCFWKYRKGLSVEVPPVEGRMVKVHDFTECKIRCVEERRFPCMAIHYQSRSVNAWKPRVRQCFLQKTEGRLRFIQQSDVYYLTAPVCIRKFKFCGWTSEKELVLRTNDVDSRRTYNVTLNECKMNCFEETAFFCRSFMYRRVNPLHSVCIHTSKSKTKLAKTKWDKVPGVTYYERKVCRRMYKTF